MKKKLSIEPNAKNISDLCKTFQEKFNKPLTPSSNCDLKTGPFQSLSLGLPWRPLRTNIAKSPVGAYASLPIKKDQKKNTTVFQLVLRTAVLSKPTSVDEKPTIWQRNPSASFFNKEPLSEGRVAKTKEAAKKFIFLESSLIAFRFVPSLSFGRTRNTFAFPYKLPLQVKKRSTRQIASHKDRSFDSNLKKKAAAPKERLDLTKGPYVFTVRPKVKKRGSRFLFGLSAALGARDKPTRAFVGLRSLFISFCFSKEKKKPSPKNAELPFLGKKGFAARRASSPFALIFSAARSAAKNRITPPPTKFIFGEETSSLTVGGLPKQLRGLKKRSSFYPKKKEAVLQTDERFLKPLVFLTSLKKRKGLKKNFFPFDFKLLKLEGSCVAKNKPSRGPATNEPAFFFSIAKKKETTLASHRLQQGSNLEHDIRKPYRRTPPFFSYWLLPFVGLLTLIPDSKLPTLPTDLKLDTLLFNVKNEAVKKENSVFPKKIAPFVFSDNAPEGHPSREAALKNRVFLTRRRSYGEATTPSSYGQPPIKKRVFLTNSFLQQPLKLAVLSEPTSFAAKSTGFQRSLSAPFFNKEPYYMYITSVPGGTSVENPYGAKLYRLAKKTSDRPYRPKDATGQQPVAMFKTQVNIKRPSSVNKLEFPSLSYTKAYLLLENIMKKQINGLSISNRQAVARRGPLCTKGATSFFLKKNPPIMFSHLRLKSRAFQPFLPEGQKERSYLSKNAQRHPQGVFRTFFEPMLTAVPSILQRSSYMYIKAPFFNKEPLSEGRAAKSKSPYFFWRRLQKLNASIKKPKKPISFLISETELLNAVSQRKPRANRTPSATVRPSDTYGRASAAKTKEKGLQKKNARPSEGQLLLNTSFKETQAHEHFSSSNNSLSLRGAAKQGLVASKPYIYIKGERPYGAGGGKGHQSLVGFQLPFSLKKEKDRIYLQSLLNQLALFRDLISDSTPPVFESLLRNPNSIKNPLSKKNSLRRGTASFGPFVLQSKKRSRAVFSKKEFVLASHSAVFQHVLRTAVLSKPLYTYKGVCLHIAEKPSMLQRSSYMYIKAPFFNKEPLSEGRAATSKGAKKRLLAFFLRKQERAFNKGYKSPLNEFGKTKADITGHYKLIQGVQSLKNSLDQIFVSSSLKNSKKKQGGTSVPSHAKQGGPPYYIYKGVAGRAGSVLRTAPPPEGKNYLASQAKGLLKIGKLPLRCAMPLRGTVGADPKQNMKDNKKIIEDSYTAWLQNEFAFLDNAVRLDISTSVRNKPPIEKLKERDYAHKRGTLYKNRCPSLFHGHKKTTSRILKMQHPILISGYTFAALKKFSASKPKLREAVLRTDESNPPPWSEGQPTRGRGPTKVLKSRAFKPLLALLPSLLRNSKQGAFIKKDMTRACDFQTSKGKASLISNLFAHSFLNLNNSLHLSAVKEGGFETSAVKKREFFKKAAPLLEPFVGGLWSAPCSALLLTVQPKTPTSDDPSRGVFRNAAHFFTDFQLVRSTPWDDVPLGRTLAGFRRASFVENLSTFQRSSLGESRPSEGRAAKSKRTLNFIHANTEAIKMASIKKVRGALFAARDSNQEWTPFKSMKERGTNHLGRKVIRIRKGEIEIRIDKLFRCFLFPAPFGQHILPLPTKNATRVIQDSKPSRAKQGLVFINHFLPLPLFLTSAAKQVGQNQKLLQKPKSFERGYVKKKRAFFVSLTSFREPRSVSLHITSLLSKHKQGVQSSPVGASPLTKDFVFIEKQKDLVRKGEEVGHPSHRWPHKTPRTESFTFLSRNSEPKEHGIHNKKEDNLLFKNRFDFSKADVNSLFLWEKKQGVLQSNSGGPKNALLFRGEGASRRGSPLLYISGGGGAAAPKGLPLYTYKGCPVGAQQAPLVVAALRAPQPRNSKLKRERLLKPLHFFRRSSSFVSKAGSLSYRPYRPFLKKGESLQNRKGAAIDPQFEKIFLKSHYNITKNAIKNSKKKRRALKQKRETGRLLKRKRFHPRPAWLRVTMYKKLLKYRHIKNDDLACPPLLGVQNKARFIERKLSFGRSHPFFAAQATTAEKEFYSISQSVFAAFQQGLWKSSWLRSNLNSYLRKIKTSFNLIKQTSQNSELGFSTKKIISDCLGLTKAPSFLQQTSRKGPLWDGAEQKYIYNTVLSKPLYTYKSFAAKSTVFQRSSSTSKEPQASAEKPYAESELRFAGAPKAPRNGFARHPFARHPFALLASRPKGAKATEYEKAVSKWNTVLQIAEYNQITYHRIQQIITNMKHSLGREGVKRTSADSLSKMSLNKSPFIGTPALPRKEAVLRTDERSLYISMGRAAPMGQRSFGRQAPNTFINNIATKSGPVDPMPRRGSSPEGAARPFNNAHHKLKRQATEGSASKPSKKAEPFLEPSTFSFNLFNFVNTVIQTPGSLKSRIHQQLKEQPFFTIQTFGNMSQKRVYWALNKTQMWHFKNSNKKEYLWANQKQREQNRSNKTKKILNKFLTLPLQEQYPGTTVVNKNQNKKKGAEVGGGDIYRYFAQQDPLVSGGPLQPPPYIYNIGVAVRRTDPLYIYKAVGHPSHRTTPPLTLFPTSLGLSLLEAEPYIYKSFAEKSSILQRPYASAAKMNVEKWKEQNQKSLNTFFKKQEQKEIKMGDLGFLDSNGSHSNLLFMKDLFANSFKESYNPNCISFFDEATGTTIQGSLLLTRKAEEHSKKHPSEAARAFFEGEKVPVFIKEHKMFLRNLKNTLRVSSPSFLQHVLRTAVLSKPTSFAAKSTVFQRSSSASKEPLSEGRAEKSLEKATNSAPLKIIKLRLSAPKEPLSEGRAAKRKGALLSSLIWSSPKSYSQMGADARPWGGVEVGAKSINYVKHNFLTVPFLRDFSFTCQKPRTSEGQLLAARTKQGPLLKRHTLMKKGANTRFMRLAMGGNYSTPVNLKIPRPFLRKKVFTKPHEAKQKQKLSFGRTPLSSEISTSMKPENFVGTLNKPLFLRGVPFRGWQKGQHRGQLFLSQSAFLLCTIIFHLCSLFSLVSLSQIRCVIKFILLLAIKLSSFVKILRFAKPFKHRTLLMAPKIRLRKVPKSSPFFSRCPVGAEWSRRSLKNPLLLLPKASLTVRGLISHAQQALPEVAPTLLKQNLSALFKKKEPLSEGRAEIPNAKPIAKQIGVRRPYGAWVRTRRKPLRLISRYRVPYIIYISHPLIYKGELLSVGPLPHRGGSTPWHKKGDPAEGSTFDVNQEHKKQKKGGLKKGRAFFRQGAKKMPLAFFLTKQRSFWVGPLSCFTRSSFFDKKNEKRATKLNTFLKIGSKKLGFVLHTGLSKVTDIRNTGTKSASVFLGKPGESLSVWINHLFLIEIAADSTTTIPENSDSSLWNSYAKLAKSSSTTPILGTLLEKRLLSSFEFFLERVSQPDTDLIVRQRKGTIFLDNLLLRTSPALKNVSESAGNQRSWAYASLREVLPSFLALLKRVTPFAPTGPTRRGRQPVLLKGSVRPKDSGLFYPHSTSKMGHDGDEKAGRSLLFSRRVTDSTIGKSMIFDWTAKLDNLLCGGYTTFACPSDGRAANPATPPLSLLKELQNTGNSKVLLLDTRVRKRWSANQFSTFKGKDSDLLIHAPPAPKSFHSLYPTKGPGCPKDSFFLRSSTSQKNTCVADDKKIGGSKTKLLQHHYNFNAALVGIAPLGTIVCQIYSGLFSKETAKSCLVVGIASSNYDEKSLLIQSLAGETEMKIIRDNANRYNFALGIKSLRNVFDALALHTPCIFLIEDIHVIGERRPLLVGDDENARADSSGESHDEKNLSVAKLTRHSIMHYRKPFRGDFSSLIPANNFSFDLFLENDFINKAQTLVVPKTTLKTTKNSLDELPWMGGLVLFQKSTYPLVVAASPQPTKAPPSLPLRGIAPQPKKASNDLAYYAIRSAARFIERKPSFGRLQPFLPSLYEQKGQAAPSGRPLRGCSRSGRPSDGPAKATIFPKEPEVQKGLLKIKNSIRIKIALLANSAVSNLSVKLNMITDLLVIIDGVRSNRGFVVFATTHIPSSLDPALRRPGRLDETIVLPFLPKLESRLEIVKAHFARSTQDAARSEATASSDSFLYKSGGPFKIKQIKLTPSLSFNLDFRFLTYSLRNPLFILKGPSFGHLSKNAPYLEVPFERLSKFTAFQHVLRTAVLCWPTSVCLHIAEKPSILKRSLSANKEPLSEGRAAKTKSKHEKSKTQSKSDVPTGRAVSPTLSAEYSSSNLLNLVATAYSKIGKLLINNKFANCAETNLSLFSTLHSQLINQQNQIQTLEPYLHLYTTQSIVKLFLMGLFAPKVAETFAFSGLIKKRRPYGAAQPPLRCPVGASHTEGATRLEKITGPLLLATQDPASSLIFSLIEKKLIYKKNVIIPRLLQFSNAALLSPQEPSGEATFVLLPARRYGSYKQTFLAMQKLMPEASEGRPSDADSLKSQVSNVESGLSDSDLGLIVEKQSLVTRGDFFDRPTLINGYYRNKVLNRHRGYLTNQWWNGHLYEHNVETTFLGDIDWRSNCFASKKGRPLKYVQAVSVGRTPTTPTKTWENFYVDFPDSDSHYNSNNRRWVLHFGYWSYWSNYKTAHNREIYSFMVTESFLETFNYLNSNREILDFFVTRIIKSGSLKDINVVEGLKRF